MQSDIPSNVACHECKGVLQDPIELDHCENFVCKMHFSDSLTYECAKTCTCQGKTTTKRVLRVHGRKNREVELYKATLTSADTTSSAGANPTGVVAEPVPEMDYSHRPHKDLVAQYHCRTTDPVNTAVRNSFRAMVITRLSEACQEDKKYLDPTVEATTVTENTQRFLGLNCCTYDHLEAIIAYSTPNHLIESEAAHLECIDAIARIHRVFHACQSEVDGTFIDPPSLRSLPRDAKTMSLEVRKSLVADVHNIAQFMVSKHRYRIGWIYGKSRCGYDENHVEQLFGNNIEKTNPLYEFVARELANKTPLTKIANSLYQTLQNQSKEMQEAMRHFKLHENLMQNEYTPKFVDVVPNSDDAVVEWFRVFQHKYARCQQDWAAEAKQFQRDLKLESVVKLAELIGGTRFDKFGRRALKDRLIDDTLDDFDDTGIAMYRKYLIEAISSFLSRSWYHAQVVFRWSQRLELRDLEDPILVVVDRSVVRTVARKATFSEGVEKVVSVGFCDYGRYRIEGNRLYWTAETAGESGDALLNVLKSWHGKIRLVYNDGHRDTEIILRHKEENEFTVSGNYHHPIVPAKYAQEVDDRQETFRPFFCVLVNVRKLTEQFKSMTESDGGVREPPALLFHALKLEQDVQAWHKLRSTIDKSDDETYPPPNVPLQVQYHLTPASLSSLPATKQLMEDQMERELAQGDDVSAALRRLLGLGSAVPLRFFVCIEEEIALLLAKAGELRISPTHISIDEESFAAKLKILTALLTMVQLNVVVVRFEGEINASSITQFLEALGVGTSGLRVVVESRPIVLEVFGCGRQDAVMISQKCKTATRMTSVIPYGKDDSLPVASAAISVTYDSVVKMFGRSSLEEKGTEIATKYESEVCSWKNRLDRFIEEQDPQRGLFVILETGDTVVHSLVEFEDKEVAEHVIVAGSQQQTENFRRLVNVPHPQYGVLVVYKKLNTLSVAQRKKIIEEFCDETRYNRTAKKTCVFVVQAADPNDLNMVGMTCDVKILSTATSVEVQSLVRDIPKLPFAEHVKLAAGKMEIPYRYFLRCMPVTEWMSHVERVRLYFFVCWGYDGNLGEVRDVSQPSLSATFITGEAHRVTSPSYETVAKETTSYETIALCSKDNRDLHWNAIEAVWSSGFTMSAVSLFSILDVCPCPVRVLCSINPLILLQLASALINGKRLWLDRVVAHLSCPIVQKQLQDWQTQPSKKTVSMRMSCVMWILLCSDSQIATELPAFTDADLHNLIKAEVKLDISALSSDDQLHKILKSMLALEETEEMPDVLMNQVGMRQYILKSCKDVSTDESFLFGSATMKLFIAVAGMGGDKSPLMKSEFITELQKIFRPRTAALDIRKKLASLSLLNRCTMRCIAYLLSVCSTPQQLEALYDVVGSREKRIEVLHETWVFDDGEVAFNAVAWWVVKLDQEARLQDMQVPFPKLLPVHNFAAFGADEEQQRMALTNCEVKLPVELSTDLMKVLIRFFKSLASSLATYKMEDRQRSFSELVSILNCCLSPTNQLYVLREMQKAESAYLLLCALWILNPLMAVSLPHADKDEAIKLLHWFVNEGNEANECRQQFLATVEKNAAMAAPLALMLTHRGATLDDGTFNTFAEGVGRKRIPIMYVRLATQVDPWPSYTLAVSQRPLMKRDAERLFQPLTYSCSRTTTLTTEQRVAKYLAVNRGVSKETIECNLEVLLSTPAGSKSSNNVDVSDKNILFGCALLWFYSLGIKDQTLIACVTSDKSDQLTKVLGDMKTIVGAARKTQDVFSPMPSSFDLHVIADAEVVELFGSGIENAVFTHSTLTQYIDVLPALGAGDDLAGIPSIFDVEHEKAKWTPEALIKICTKAFSARFANTYKTGQGEDIAHNALCAYIAAMRIVWDHCPQNGPDRATLMATEFVANIVRLLPFDDFAAVFHDFVLAISLPDMWSVYIINNLLDQLRQMDKKAVPFAQKISPSLWKELEYANKNWDPRDHNGKPTKFDFSGIEKLEKKVRKDAAFTSSISIELLETVKKQAGVADLDPLVATKASKLPDAAPQPHKPQGTDVKPFFALESKRIVVADSNSSNSAGRGQKVARESYATGSDGGVVDISDIGDFDFHPTACISTGSFFTDFVLKDVGECHAVKLVGGDEGHQKIVRASDLTESATVLASFRDSYNAWEYCSSLPRPCTLVHRGFFLTKTKNHTFAAYVLSDAPAREGEYSAYPWNILQYHRHLGIRLGEEEKALRVALLWVLRIADLIGKTREETGNASGTTAYRPNGVSADAQLPVVVKMLEEACMHEGENREVHHLAYCVVKHFFVELTRKGRMIRVNIKDTITELQQVQVQGSPAQASEYYGLMRTMLKNNWGSQESELKALGQCSSRFMGLLDPASHTSGILATLISAPQYHVRRILDGFTNLRLQEAKDIEALENLIKGNNDPKVIDREGLEKEYYENLDLAKDLEENAKLAVLERDFGYGPMPRLAVTNFCNKSSSTPPVLSFFVTDAAKNSSGRVVLGCLYDRRISRAVENMFLEDTIDALKKKHKEDWTPEKLVGESKATCISFNAAFDRWMRYCLISPLSAELKNLFFTLLCSRSLRKAENMFVDDKQPRGTPIICYCLAQALPLPYHAQLIKNRLGLSARVTRLCKRRNDTYGLVMRSSRVINDEIVGVCHDGFTAQNGASDADTYIGVVSKFSDFVTHVEVRGLPAMSDVLMKSFAEYTFRYPWRFIFIYDCNTIYNVPENRDRIIPSGDEDSVVKTVVTTTVHYEREKALSIDELTKDPNKRWARLSTALVGEWEDWLEKAVKEGGLTLIVSPPGAGKSYLMDSMRETYKDSRIIFLLDCSNDRLIFESMRSLLDRNCPTEEGLEIMLIADEYHFLTAKKKKELMDWLCAKAGKLNVVLVANRSEKLDDELIESCKKRFPKNTVHHIRARLSAKKVDLVCRDVISGCQNEAERKKASDFIFAFHCARRALFSDNACTLRDRKIIFEAFNGGQTDDPRCTVGLQQAMMEKLPALGPFVGYFVQCFWRCIYEVKWRLTPDQQTGTPLKALMEEAIKNDDPLKLLVLASLSFTQAVDCSTCDMMLSVQEFSANGTVIGDIGAKTDNLILHPVQRLTMWVVYAMKYFDMEPIDSAKIEGCFARLQVIDQVGFPIICGMFAEPASLEKCDAAKTDGPFHDLDWIYKAVKSGKALDWNSDIRNAWKQRFVTAIDMLENILLTAPDSRAVLSALAPENLLSILQTLDPQNFIAETVLSSYPPTCIKEERGSFSAPFTSLVWRRTRMTSAEEMQKTEQFREDVRTRTQRLGAACNMDGEIVLLQWVNQYGKAVNTVADDLHGRTLSLQNWLLAVVAERVEDEAKFNDVWWEELQLIVYGGSLEYLLDIKGPFNIRLAMRVAKKTEFMPREWSEPLRILWKVAHGMQISLAEVLTMFDRNFIGVDCPELVRAAVAAKPYGDMPDRLQRHLVSLDVAVDLKDCLQIEGADTDAGVLEVGVKRNFRAAAAAKDDVLPIVLGGEVGKKIAEFRRKIHGSAKP